MIPVGEIIIGLTELAKLALITRNAYIRTAQAAGMTEEEKDKLYAQEEQKMLANDPASFPKPWEETSG